MVKSLFGLLQLFYFHFNVIDKFYRQVLTPVNISQLLLKLVILYKFRLVPFHTLATQRNYNMKLVYNSLGETRVIMTLIRDVPF